MSRLVVYLTLFFLMTILVTGITTFAPSSFEEWKDFYSNVTPATSDVVSSSFSLADRICALAAYLTDKLKAYRAHVAPVISDLITHFSPLVATIRSATDYSLQLSQTVPECVIDGVYTTSMALRPLKSMCLDIFDHVYKHANAESSLSFLTPVECKTWIYVLSLHSATFVISVAAVMIFWTIFIFLGQLALALLDKIQCLLCDGIYNLGRWILYRKEIPQRDARSYRNSNSKGQSIVGGVFPTVLGPSESSRASEQHVKQLRMVFQLPGLLWDCLLEFLNFLNIAFGTLMRGNKSFYNRARRTENELESLQEKLEYLQHEYRLSEGERQRLSQELEQLRQSKADEVAELNNKHEHELDVLRLDIEVSESQRRREIYRLQTQLQQHADLLVNEQIRALHRRLSTKSDLLNTRNQQLQEKEEQISSLRKSSDKTQRQKKKMQSEIVKLRQENDNLLKISQNHLDLEIQYKDKSAEALGLKRQLEQLRTDSVDSNTLKTKISELELSRQELQKTNEAAVDQQTRAEKISSRQSKDIMGLYVRIDILESQLALNKDKVARTESLLDEIVQLKASLSNKIAHLSRSEIKIMGLESELSSKQLSLGSAEAKLLDLTEHFDNLDKEHKDYKKWCFDSHQRHGQISLIDHERLLADVQSKDGGSSKPKHGDALGAPQKDPSVPQLKDTSKPQNGDSIESQQLLNRIQELEQRYIDLEAHANSESAKAQAAEKREMQAKVVADNKLGRLQSLVQQLEKESAKNAESLAAAHKESTGAQAQAEHLAKAWKNEKGSLEKQIALAQGQVEEAKNGQFALTRHHDKKFGELKEQLDRARKEKQRSLRRQHHMSAAVRRTRWKKQPNFSSEPKRSMPQPVAPTPEGQDLDMDQDSNMEIDTDTQAATQKQFQSDRAMQAATQERSEPDRAVDDLSIQIGDRSINGGHILYQAPGPISNMGAAAPDEDVTMAAQPPVQPFSIPIHHSTPSFPHFATSAVDEPAAGTPAAGTPAIGSPLSRLSSLSSISSKTFSSIESDEERINRLKEEVYGIKEKPLQTSPTSPISDAAISERTGQQAAEEYHFVADPQAVSDMDAFDEANPGTILDDTDNKSESVDSTKSDPFGLAGSDDSTDGGEEAQSEAVDLQAARSDTSSVGDKTSKKVQIQKKLGEPLSIRPPSQVPSPTSNRTDDLDDHVDYEVGEILEEESVEDEPERTKFVTDKPPSNEPPAKKESARKTWRNREEEVQDRYDTMFPYGHRKIPTSGEGLLCGLRAVIGSMQSMNLPFPIPTLTALQAIAESPEWRQEQADFSLTNVNNFSVDQIHDILNRWGRASNLVFRLGILVEGRPPWLWGDDAPYTVWIANDNAEASSTPENVVYSHFSGVRRTQTLSDKPVPPVRATKETLDNRPMATAYTRKTNKKKTPEGPKAPSTSADPSGSKGKPPGQETTTRSTFDFVAPGPTATPIFGHGEIKAPVFDFMASVRQAAPIFDSQLPVKPIFEFAAPNPTGTSIFGPIATGKTKAPVINFMTSPGQAAPNFDNQLPADINIDHVTPEAARNPAVEPTNIEKSNAPISNPVTPEQSTRVPDNQLPADSEIDRVPALPENDAKFEEKSYDEIKVSLTTLSEHIMTIRRQWETHKLDKGRPLLMLKNRYAVWRAAHLYCLSKHAQASSEDQYNFVQSMMEVVPHLIRSLVERHAQVQSRDGRPNASSQLMRLAVELLRVGSPQNKKYTLKEPQGSFAPPSVENCPFIENDRASRTDFMRKAAEPFRRFIEGWRANKAEAPRQESLQEAYWYAVGYLLWLCELPVNDPVLKGETDRIWLFRALLALVGHESLRFQDPQPLPEGWVKLCQLVMDILRKLGALKKIEGS